VLRAGDFFVRPTGFVSQEPGGRAGTWICYFFALKFLDRSIVNTLFAGIGPFVIIIVIWASGHPIARPRP
jgi:hypothetical protein